MELIRVFEGLGKHDAPIAGGKGASLGEMTQAGIPVPGGFVVLSSAFEQFLEETDLNVEIDSILRGVDTKAMHTIEHASETIQKLILEAKMPKDITTLISTSFTDLNTPFVAVRSSATAEDSASAAWAGQLDSFLNTTEATLLENVQRCWASLFTPRAIFYRFEQGLNESKISVAVVVQKMVESEVSGIAFSVHPVTEDRNQLIIEAGFGLGEAIVSGQVTPDSYVVGKSPREIMDSNVSTQTRALYRVGEAGGNEWRDIQEPKASSQVLTEAQILELSELIIHIENHYGFPCDIEWAYEAGKFYIVQSRPITTLTNEDVVNEDKGVVRILERAEEKSLADTCIASFGIQELFPPYHNSTLFVQTSGWNTRKYFGKHYADIETFPLLITLKEGEGIMYIPATKAKNLSEEVFKSYLKHSLSLHERLEEYKKQTEIIDRIYQDVIVSNLLTTKSFEELVPYMEEMRSAVWEMNTLAFFSIYFDKEMCGKILNDIHSEISAKQLDALWERGTTPISDSFEKRRENLVLSLLDVNSAWEEIGLQCQYFGATYNNVFDLVSVENELKEKFAHLIDNEHRKRIIAEGDSLKKKMTHDHEEWCAARTLDEQKLIHYLQTIIDVRDSRKDYISKFLLVVFRISQKLFRDASVDEKLIYFYMLDEIMKGKDYLLENRELLEKRLLGCSVFVDYDGAVRIEYGDFEKTKSRLGDFFLKQQNHLLNSKTINGQSGSSGKVRGKVSVVMNLEKDSHKFTEVSVLVTGMTRPEFVPLMKKSLAIITDEGGITCHAAIVSRELGIPCVVGTKIATQVLKDGDLVEVDADNGVVRVIERAEEKEGVPKVHDYQRLFQWKGGFSYFLNSFFMRIYAELGAVTFYDGSIWQSYLPKREQEKTLKEGQLLYSSINLYQELQDGIGDGFLKLKEQFQSLLERDLLTREEVEAYFALVTTYYKFYQKTEFFYTDGAFLAQNTDTITKKNLESFGDLKMKGREQLNIIALIPGCYLDQILLKIGSGRGLTLSDLKNLSMDEVLKIFEFEDVDEVKHTTKERESAYFVTQNEAVSGDEAKKRVTDFLGERELGESLIGQTVFRAGKVTARARVFSLSVTDLSKVGMLVEAMEKGEILIAETTAPEIIEACKKAVAIVTNQGGLLSHAAITSRELKIPCVIGTQYATEVIQTGDLVEVDADTGVVRVIEKVK